ncbi:cyclopropane-fatty-acyl-phospholipid synthase [Bosea sp. AAP35]|uniref:SAM-dependent methyltransferase n=1 Tax=Bosea sp. AAP35 TaxID=1523417 RepID=UPI0006B8D0E0|nr:cyclopropane-fatty-acyl-phospholipid synthase family protein [Bosea sp. AAP35]KPF62833.1 cyclopropane-fatty-acyl-phospholipid synthase [Bosea sp. AAP35]
MSFLDNLGAWGERLPLPDVVSRAGISALVSRTNRHLERGGARPDDAFIREMADYPIAEHTDAANQQHYEVPAAFFEVVLGARRKYSSCYYETPHTTLDQAEVKALELTLAHAGLEDGQRILELGCGWGSLSLFMAERLPRAEIVAVSNSASQRAFIEGQAAARGLGNLRIVTADMNAFACEGGFDRIVSVEMFEHMANWTELLGRARGWLKSQGRLFMHVFTHRNACYRFDVNDTSDWIAQHFFTGGLMPSRRLIHGFPALFAVEDEWHWSGTHYSRTAEDWLVNFDRNRAVIDPILKDVYGADAALWRRRWRLFFLATSGLFGHESGEAWGVGHYRLRPA